MRKCGRLAFQGISGTWASVGVYQPFVLSTFVCADFNSLYYAVENNYNY